MNDPRWVKFTQRHPADGGFYLISLRNTRWDGSAVVDSITVKTYDRNLKTFYGFKPDPGWNMRVTAWMELPQPYKEEN